MKKLALALLLTVLGYDSSAFAAEYQEFAMCTAVASGAAFPRISIQGEPGRSGRGLLILSASDGWTQVYSGRLQTSGAALMFDEDKHVISASFSKASFQATISFNGDQYVCDERSFGN